MTTTLPKMSQTLSVLVTDAFTPEMDLLRRSGFYGADCRESSSDAFDPYSCYVNIACAGELTASVRLTPHPHSVLRAYACTPTLLPTGPKVVDITRGVVSERWRGIGLYKLLITEAMLEAAKRNMEFMLGAVEEEYLLPFWYQLGAEPLGEKTTFQANLGGRSHCQCIRFEPLRYRKAVLAAHAESIRRLAERKFHICSGFTMGGDAE
jgi:predicted GNAT family N-acyltransferase